MLSMGAVLILQNDEVWFCCVDFMVIQELSNSQNAEIFWTICEYSLCLHQKFQMLRLGTDLFY